VNIVLYDDKASDIYSYNASTGLGGNGALPAPILVVNEGDLLDGLFIEACCSQGAYFLYVPTDDPYAELLPILRETGIDAATVSTPTVAATFDKMLHHLTYMLMIWGVQALVLLIGLFCLILFGARLYCDNYRDRIACRLIEGHSLLSCIRTHLVLTVLYYGAVAAGLPLAYFFVFNDDQKGRINAFLNPELDVQGSGYNVMQSKIAIGSGQLYGKGYFSSGTLAQLRFVPERHTDFVFAGIVEGVGFVGGVLLIVAFFLLIFRWIWIAVHAKDYFGMCLVAGCAGMLLAHVFENIGMTIGLMPVTGIPLPFISYGGSNLLTNMIAVGIVENVWMRRPEKK